MILDVLCDSVDFEFGLVDFYLRVSSGDSVDLSVHLLLLENGSLSNVNGEFGVTIWLVGGKHFFFEFVFLYHQLEIYINVFA